MISLFDSNITSILPEVLSGKNEVIALGYAINKATQRMLSACEKISVYAAIDVATDEVLDLLAIELNTQYYDTSLNIDAKRRLIKGTLSWYMKAGTPAAIEELIQAVFGEGTVQEWFEYGGDPFYFKVKTNATLTPEISTLFSEMLQRVKNARSHIEAIEIHRTIEQEIMTGVGQHSNYKPAAIIDGYDIDSSTNGIVYAGAVSHTQTHPAPILDGYSVEGEEVKAETYSGTAVAATVKQAAITENLNTKGETITQAIAAGTAAGSIYKNTITE